MRTKADKIEDLQLIASSTESFKIMREESTSLHDICFAEIQVSVDQAQIQKMCSLMKKTGEVKTVTYQSRMPTREADEQLQTVKKRMKEQMSPDPEVQKSEMCELQKKTLKPCDTWYLVDIGWYKQRKRFVNYDNGVQINNGGVDTHPGPIDNSALLKVNGELKEYLVDDLDYTLLPEEAWTRLLTWYGIVKGQNSISRKVIQQGMFVKHCKVEVYLLTLKLCHVMDVNNFVQRQFSCSDTIGDLELIMRTEYNIASEKEVRLWNRYMSSTWEHLSKPKNTLDDAGLYQGQLVTIEERNEDGSWPRNK